MQRGVIPKRLLVQLANYKVVKCGMHHEKVVGGGVGTETLERNGLCATRERSVRLGCAHASSDRSFRSILSEMETYDRRFGALKEDFSKAMIQVYRLDHKKGDLEKQLFCSAGTERVIIQEQIDETLGEHRALLDVIESVYNRSVALGKELAGQIPPE